MCGKTVGALLKVDVPDAKLGLLRGTRPHRTHKAAWHLEDRTMFDNADGVETVTWVMLHLLVLILHHLIIIIIIIINEIDIALNMVL